MRIRRSSSNSSSKATCPPRRWRARSASGPMLSTAGSTDGLSSMTTPAYFPITRWVPVTSLFRDLTRNITLCHSDYWFESREVKYSMFDVRMFFFRFFLLCGYRFSFLSLSMRLCLKGFRLCGPKRISAEAIMVIELGSSCRCNTCPNVKYSLDG